MTDKTPAAEPDYEAIAVELMHFHSGADLRRAIADFGRQQRERGREEGREQTARKAVEIAYAVRDEYQSDVAEYIAVRIENEFGLEDR